MAEEQATQQGNRENRPPREGGRPQSGGERRGGPGGGDRRGPGGERREGRGPGGPGGDRRPEGPPEIDIDKLINDSLYLDNQAQAEVSRMRDMD
jgi:hypothetical protein